MYKIVFDVIHISWQLCITSFSMLYTFCDNCVYHRFRCYTDFLAIVYNIVFDVIQISWQLMYNIVFDVIQISWQLCITSFSMLYTFCDNCVALTLSSFWMLYRFPGNCVYHRFHILWQLCITSFSMLYRFPSNCCRFCICILPELFFTVFVSLHT